MTRPSLQQRMEAPRAGREAHRRRAHLSSSARGPARMAMPLDADALHDRGRDVQRLPLDQMRAPSRQGFALLQGPRRRRHTCRSRLLRSTDTYEYNNKTQYKGNAITTSKAINEIKTQYTTDNTTNIYKRLLPLLLRVCGLVLVVPGGLRPPRRRDGDRRPGAIPSRRPRLRVKEKCTLVLGAPVAFPGARQALLACAARTSPGGLRQTEA